MGSSPLLDTPVPQDLLSLLVASMEKPCAGMGVPVLPESVRLDGSAVFELIGSALGRLACSHSHGDSSG